MKSLEDLSHFCSRKNIVIIGGGPSLDYCLPEIKNLVGLDSIFFLSDIVSRKFIDQHPLSERVVFTVEARNHHYLRGLKGEKVAIYLHARKENINSRFNDLFGFHFDFDKMNPKESFLMRSPGTVIGPAVYWALYLSLKMRGVKNIFLFGVDLFYINNQIYNRLCHNYINHTYWDKRENAEWIGLVKKSSTYEYKNGFIIRTSREFKQTILNINTLLENSATDVPIWDYSPLGISEKWVKKSIPEEINCKKIGT